MSRDLTAFLRAQQRALLRRCADQASTAAVAATSGVTSGVTRFDIVMRQLALEQKESRRRTQASAYMREWRANQSAKAARKETKQ